MKKFTILKNNIFFIFILSFTIFFIKWSISYWYYGIEDIFTKIIFNPSGDHSYYPFVHQFSNLNFAEGYSILFKKLNLIGFPYIASLAHTIFYKVFGLYGFIIMELLCIFFFLIIFFYIFKEINFTNEYSIILAFFLFSLPLILILINEFSIPYIFNLKQLYSGFYSLRFPRPLVTNLFFFAFILFILKFYLSNEINSKKYFLISSLFIGLLFNSFFYFSLVCFGLANILFIIKYKKIILKKTILKKYLHFILLLIIVCSPFIIQLVFIENDYFARVGTFEISQNAKIYLYKHLLQGFIKIESLLLIILNILFYFININIDKNSKKILDVFLWLFLISIFLPFAYLLIFKSATFFSNFVFVIILTGFIFLKINIFIFIKKKFFKISKNVTKFLIVSSVVFLIIVNFNYYKKTYKVDSLAPGVHFNPQNPATFRSDFKKTIDFVNSLKIEFNKDTLLLTNDIHIQIWWIFSDYKYFYFPYVFFTSLKDKMIETQLINAFKYLDLNLDDFLNFINQNKITNWRVVNANNYFFLGHLKYQANYLTKFSELENYPKKTHSLINKKSIHHTNQIILPLNELKRLEKKFNLELVKSEMRPDLIILNKNENLQREIIKNNHYCTKYKNNNFVVLTFKNQQEC